MSWCGTKVIVCLAVLGFAPNLRADLFSYVDSDGVMHFTNINRSGAKRLKGAADGQPNTYGWQDEAGTLRWVHRVDVGHFDAIIVEAANYYSLPPALIKAVMAVESAFQPKAISPAGALGLMQLLPGTAADMFVKDCHDPQDNIYGGTRYLRILANRFSGDLRLTLAAYNAGPEAVTRFGGVPEFSETRNYVRRVLTLYRHYLDNWKLPR